MRVLKLGLGLAALPLLNGCIAKTAFDVVTAPVRVASKGVDLATTSQSEADEKRGRQMRQREEQRGKLDRRYRKLDEKCRDGDRKACGERDDVEREIEALTPATTSRSEN